MSRKQVTATDKIDGFEFLVSSQDSTGRWMPLHGSGGKLGNGYLAALNREDSRLDLAKVVRRLMAEAGAQARHGAVHEHVSTPGGSVGFRVATHDGAQVEACRAVPVVAGRGGGAQ